MIPVQLLFQTRFIHMYDSIVQVLNHLWVGAHASDFHAQLSETRGTDQSHGSCTNNCDIHNQFLYIIFSVEIFSKSTNKKPINKIRMNED